jgi:ABC-type amino acid transport substrate-binding protein
MRIRGPKKFNHVLLCLALILSGFYINAQQADTLQVCYYNQNPYAYAEGETVKGLEVEIIQAYVLWLEEKKKMQVPLKFSPYTSFEDFYFSFKRVKGNRIGLGSVTINPERTKDIDFTAPYLKDVAFLITNGHSADIRTKTPNEIMQAIGSMTAVTMNNTSLNKYVLEFKKEYIKQLPIIYEKDEKAILDDINRNPLHFGYVNSVTFWYYLRKYPQKFLKMQKVLSKSTQQLGFILPKESPHKALFDEFFAGPGGFKSTPKYKALLEKYLGTFMAESNAVK